MVYLVGGGPGHPGLITLRAVECLARADVVLYDYLVNPEVLEHAAPGARLICLGRHGQGRLMPQAEVNRLLVEQATGGRVVVRLKGGDPTIFGRAAEEADAVRSAGIPLEIVPGITAALASASFAGIPITHRDYASCVALVTGQQGGRSRAETLDYDALARFPGTLVFYMGITTAPAWSRRLLDAGMPADTPTAVVRRCSWPDQHVIRCELGEISQVLAPKKMRPPAVVIVGKAAHSDLAAPWFTSRPLFGQTVMVTRPRHQAAPLRASLSELGARVIVHPAIEILPPADWNPVDDAIAHLASFDWLVFSSSNGVRFLLDRIIATGRDLRCLGTTRIAAIGPGTAECLASYRLRADLQPDSYRAEGLAGALRPHAAGNAFLLARASRGRQLLADELRAAGASVRQVVVYASHDVETSDPAVSQALAAGDVAWTTVTSSAIARSLVRQFGAALRHTRLVSISPVTSDTLRSEGYPPYAEATTYTTSGVVDALVAAAGKSGRPA